MKPIGDHELNPGLIRGPNHRAAVFLGDCHRLFAQNMNACACRFNAVLRVQMIGESNIHRIDHAAAQTITVFRVRKELIDMITTAKGF